MLPAGSAELRSWVQRSEPPRELRDALMLRMRAAAVVGPDAAVPQLREHLALHRARLEEYVALEQRWFPEPDADDPTRLQHLVLQAGIGLEQHWVEWLHHALDQLAQDDPSG